VFLTEALAVEDIIETGVHGVDACGDAAYRAGRAARIAVIEARRSRRALPDA
jgi:hypothetical protein